MRLPVRIRAGGGIARSPSPRNALCRVQRLLLPVALLARLLWRRYLLFSAHWLSDWTWLISSWRLFVVRQIVRSIVLFSNYPNCLIKNLSETHSLPHVRNLSEMSRSECLNGRQNEVNDERQENCNQGVVKPVSEGQQEGEGAGSGRAGCIDGVQPLVRGRAVAVGWQSDPRRATGASGR